MMKEFKPKLFSVMKNYSGSQLVKDIVAGIIVAIIALPLSIALAIASGVLKKNSIAIMHPRTMIATTQLHINGLKKELPI